MARLDRTISTVRAATTLAPARPAYAAGFRAAVSTVGPLAVATLLGNPAAGTWLSLGGFNAALSDRGGSYRDRATTLAAVTAGTATAILLGSTAGGDIRVAVPLTFLVAFVASLVRVWGNAGISIGSASLSTFVIALAYPAASLPDAVTRTGLGVAGGCWAMAIALVLWPLRPYRPARLAVAASYRALGAFVDDVAHAVARTRVGARADVPVGSAVVRAALEQARGVLATLRRGRPSASGRGQRLLILGDLVDQVFGHVAAAAETIETIPPEDRDPSAQLVVIETLAMVASTARAIALAVEAEHDAPAVPMGWSGEALRALVTSQQPYGRAMSAAAIQYLHAASILDRAARFAESAVSTVAQLNDGRGRMAPVEGAIADNEREDATSAVVMMRALLTPASVMLRYALRVGVVVALAVLLGHVFDLKRAYWISITVIVIMQPYTGATTHRALQRVLGTVLGGILTAALGALFHDPRAILVLAFIFAAMCVALMPLNYAAFSVFLTPTFVLLAEASAGDWHLAGTRVINTLLGGALALAGARLLWPSPEATRLPGYMGAAMRANGEYLRRVVALFADRSEGAGEQLRFARRDAGLASVNMEESFQRLVGEHDGPVEALAPAMTFLTYTRRLTASLASLALARHTSPPSSATALAPFAEAASAVLDDLAVSLESERAPATLARFSVAAGNGPAVPPLLQARVDRLDRQLSMLHEATGRWAGASELRC